MTDEEKQEIRDAVMGVMGKFDRKLDEVEARLVARFDDAMLSLEVELAAVRERLDGIEQVVGGSKLHLADISRQQIKDRIRLERLEREVFSKRSGS